MDFNENDNEEVSELLSKEANYLTWLLRKTFGRNSEGQEAERPFVRWVS